MTRSQTRLGPLGWGRVGSKNKDHDSGAKKDRGGGKKSVGT